MANGFLKPSRTSTSFEEAAEEYLEDLVKRSLVLVTRRDVNGKVKRCCIHDLVRDLCIRKAEEEKFILHSRDGYIIKVLPESITNHRRIIITCPKVDCHKNIRGSNIRTIIWFHRTGWLKSTRLGFLGKFKLLRVLDLLKCKLGSLAVEVFELYQLRYFAFTYPIKVPATVSKLLNLQTLIIHPRKKYNYMTLLPLEIWKIPQLRHLISFSFGHLPDPRGATCTLENLETLSDVRNFIWTSRILKMIPNLKKLGISCSGKKHFEDYHLENLVHLHQLEKLKLRICPGFSFGEKLNPVFPMALQKLTLIGWIHPWKGGTIFGSLPNLEVLKLREYTWDEDKWEISEGEFPKLKFLLIEQSNIRQWITESSHFPSLKCLMVYGCNNLIELPDGIGETPTLELIKVDDQNGPLFDSAKKVQEEQRSWGNDALQVRRVHRLVVSSRPREYTTKNMI